MCTQSCVGSFFFFFFCGPGDYLFGPVAFGTDQKDAFFGGEILSSFVHPHAVPTPYMMTSIFQWNTKADFFKTNPDHFNESEMLSSKMTKKKNTP